MRNEDGTEAIRPLTKEERDWLSQFYAEVEHGNFKNTRELKQHTKRLKDLRRQYRVVAKSGDIASMETKFKEVEAQEKIVRQLREETNCFYVTDEDRKEIYDRDNSRRRDVFNTSKVSNNLVYYDLNEYDKFTSDAIIDSSHEDRASDEFSDPLYQPRKRRKKG